TPPAPSRRLSRPWSSRTATFRRRSTTSIPIRCATWTTSPTRGAASRYPPWSPTRSVSAVRTAAWYFALMPPSPAPTDAERERPNGEAAPRRAVAITGVGLVSPLGQSTEQLWQSLRAGVSGIGDVPHLPLDAYRTRIGGAVRNFQPRQYISDPKSLKLMTRPVRLGVAAVELAARDAGLENSAALDPARIACFVGSPGHAGDRDELLRGLDLSYTDQGLDLGKFGAEGIATINPLWLLKSLANLVLYFVSLKLGAQGPNANICMSGAGGSMALGEAFHAIRYGRADVAVAGGYESLLDEERLESFEPSGLLYLGNGAAQAASRPFDRDRAGFVAAEGGAFLVLE